MKRGVLLLTIPLAITGCVAYQPIIDTRGVDMNRYVVDERECKQYAAQVDPASNAAAGAVGGAAVGAVLGAIFGNRRDAGNLAAVGALAGAVGGGTGSAEVQRDIFRRCMAGRGYNVLY